MLGVEIESNMVTITSLCNTSCAKQSKQGKATLDRKLKECKDKYGDKLFRTVSIGNVKEVKK